MYILVVGIRYIVWFLLFFILIAIHTAHTHNFNLIKHAAARLLPSVFRLRYTIFDRIGLFT